MGNDPLTARIFTHPRPLERPIVLAIGGSDSSAGAGVQADVKAVAANGGYARTEGLVVGRSREVMARRRDGSLFPADLAVSAFQAETGERRYLGILLDTSARKDAEAEAMRSQRWEALGTLVAGVAHDFNNLLTGITGGLSLLRDHPADPRWLDIAERSANRAAALVQQLLQVARPAEGEVQWFEPRPVVERALQLAAETFYRRIELSLQAQPVRWGVLGDRTQIDQIVLNLLVNARDAVLDRALHEADPDFVPRIAVSVDERVLDGGPAVSIRVVDNGTGMSPEVRRQAFDPFFTTKPEGTGTGLGLSMVQSLVSRHRGVLRLETAPMQGCAFEVLLPLVPDPGAVPQQPEPALQRDRTIDRLALVVDDEAIVGEVARAYLQDFGYRVRLVGGGAEALECLRTGVHFDLVLLDANMPAPDGWEVLRQIREMASPPPVVVMSGMESGEDAVAQGAAGYVEKPFTRDALISVVRAVLDD